MKSQNDLKTMEKLFLALADQTRLRILNLLREEEISVCYFTEVLNISQPKISRHLAYLRNSGIVSARREGKWMNYRIVLPKNLSAASVLQKTLEWLKSQKEMQTDYEKLLGFCRLTEDSTTIGRAPTPNIFGQTNMKIEKGRELEIFLL